MGLKVGKRERPGDLLAELARKYQRARPLEQVPEEVLADREAVKVGGLRAFVRLGWPHVDPSTFRDNWHIGAICEHLDACRMRQIQRLLINVPPGTSKSRTTSVLWPAHVWTEDPTWAWITAAYSPRLSNGLARLHRDLVFSDWYRARWPRGAVDSLQSIVQFSNGAGGWRLSTTPGSEATGFHPDCQIVDDPIKPQDARDVRAGETRAKLDAVGDWWSGTMSTRARDRATLVRVIIMQRVHDVDLAGRMMAEGGWEHLVLPMEYDPKIFWHLYPDREAAGGSPHCETALGRPDPRREVGGLLDPARFPQAEVDALRVELADAASAQLDQNPVTPGGGIFKEDYFRRRWTLRPVKNEPDRRQLPSGLILFSSWDLRFKDDAERGSYVVGEVWGYTPGTPDLYLVHQVRGRWGFAETEDEFLQVAQGWPMCLTHLVENKANGPALKSSMARKAYEAGLQEPEIELVDAMGSKILRANVAEPTWRAGRVWLPEDADWVPEFVREHVRFPRYKSDDQVDAASQAIAWARTSEGARVGDYLAGVREAARGMRP